MAEDCFPPLEDFLARRFPDGRPSDRTLNNWGRRGLIVLVKVGNARFVDEARTLAAWRAQNDPAPRRRGRPPLLTANSAA